MSIPRVGLLSDAPGPSSPAGGLGEADPQSLIQMQNPEGSDHQMFLGNSFVRLGLTGSIQWWWWQGGLTGIETWLLMVHVYFFSYESYSALP